MPEAEYRGFVEAAEDADDLAHAKDVEQRLARRETELLPAEMVQRMIAGENLVRLWREHRGLKANALAAAAGISPAYLSDIESGKRDGTISTMKALAAALGVDIGDLV